MSYLLARGRKFVLPLVVLACNYAGLHSQANELFIGQIVYDQVFEFTSPGAGSDLELLLNALNDRFTGGGTLTVDFAGELKFDEYILQPPVTGNQAVYTTNPGTVNSVDYSFEVGGVTYDFGNVPPLAPPGVFLTDGFTDDRAALAYGLGQLDGDILGGSLVLDIELPPLTLNPDNLDDGVPDILDIYANRPGTLVGDFATSNLLDNSGGQILISGRLTNFQLQPAGVPGDYNCDGVVNAADYLIYRNNEGTNFTLKNENPAATTPGVVDDEDYEFWKQNYGNSLSALDAIPEPTAVVLVIAAGGILSVRRWRAQRIVPILIATVAIGATNARQAVAESVTFGFTGTVTASDLATFDATDTIAGSATFESTAPDSDPIVAQGRYATAITGFNLVVSSSYAATFNAAGTTSNIQVVDDSPVDLFSVLASVSGDDVDGQALEAATFTLIEDLAPSSFITSAALPTTAPSLAAADIAAGSLRFSGANFVEFDVTSLVAVVDDNNGDFQLDGDVDGMDFLRWQRGQSPNPFSATDLATWIANYGNAAPSTALTAVPEPSTAALLSIACMLASTRFGANC